MPFGEVLIQFWQNPLKILYGVLVAITNFIVNLLETIIEWGMKVLGAFAEGAAQAIEAAIKAIILILAFILLALNLFFLIIGFLLTVGILLILSIFVNAIMVASFLSLSIEMDTFFYEIKYEIEWGYVEFIDLKLPFIKETHETSEIQITKKDPIFLGESVSEKNIYNTYKIQNNDQENLDNLKNLNNNETIDETFPLNVINGMTLGFNLLTVFMGIFAAAFAIPDPYGKILNIISWGLFIASIIFVGYSFFQLLTPETRETHFSNAIGLGVSLIIGAVIIGIFLKLLKFGGTPDDILALFEDLSDFWSIIYKASLVFDIIGASIDIFQIFPLDEIFLLALGITGFVVSIIAFLIASIICIFFTTDESKRSQIKTFAIISSCVGLGFLIYGGIGLMLL
ncbi:MAG: hypothetical protein GF329_03185 [Candidatus Lokiarchaeota archaeon]|nr:hypothetical protein [Candidatus Lokiarchaeota archaeon]